MRYSVHHENELIFASRYKLVLPSEEGLIKELERERAQLSKVGAGDRNRGERQFGIMKWPAEAQVSYQEPSSRDKVATNFIAKIEVSTFTP